VSGNKAKEGWWANVEDEILDVQKTLRFYPSPSLVERWKAQGRLHTESVDRFDDLTDAEAKMLEKVGVHELARWILL